MQKLPKVKVVSPTTESLRRIAEINLNKARDYYAAFPAHTPISLKLKTGLSMKFIEANWDKIIHL